MKRFLINSTSNLLSALAIGGAVLLAAAPAKADSGDFARAVIGIVVLDHILRPQQDRVVVQQPQHIYNHYHNNYSVERCGYQENVFRNGYSTVVEKRNSCTGQLIQRRETFN